MAVLRAGRRPTGGEADPTALSTRRKGQGIPELRPAGRPAEQDGRDAAR